MEAITRELELKDLNPAPYNPREIEDDAYQGLGNSMSDFGLLKIIVWNERTGNMVGGHQRYKILMESGVTKTEVVVVNLSDDDEVALNLALNSKTAKADFSPEIINMLAKAEVQMGSKFNHVGLNNFAKTLEKLKFSLEPDTSRPPKKDKPQSSQKPQTFIDDKMATGLNEPEAIITCPSCQSMWRMRDNKVIKKTV